MNKSPINKSQIMQAAWAIFRTTYHYPAIPFNSIGHKCFGWALAEAYRRSREAARIAAIPADAKAARIAELTRARELESYRDSWRIAQHRIREIDAELSALAA